MKKVPKVILILALWSSNGQAQSGRIIYEENRHPQINISSDIEEKEEIESFFPKSRLYYKQLIFSFDESIYINYENLEKEKEDQIYFTTSSGSQGVYFLKGLPDNEFYRDFTNEQIVEKIVFMRKNFIIEEPARKLTWKISNETKSMLGYDVIKATAKDSIDIIEAWFAPQISTSAGPSRFSGLPGLILELELNDGERTITAIKVELGEGHNREIEVPTGGKKVSRAELLEIKRQKIKERKEMSGGKSSSIILRKH